MTINWFALLVLLLKATNWLFRYMDERKLIGEGEARTIKALREDTDARVEAALKARADAADANANGSLLDDDGYQRKD